jgi:hypothetical protein
VLHTVIALTYKFDAAGSQWAGEIMVLVFSVGQAVYCGYVLFTLLKKKTPKFFLSPLVFIMHKLLLHMYSRSQYCVSTMLIISTILTRGTIPNCYA